MKKISVLTVAFGICLSLNATPPLANFNALVKMNQKDAANLLYGLFDKDETNSFTKKAIEVFGAKFNGEKPKAPSASVDVPWTDADKTTIVKFVKLFRGGSVDAYGKKVEGKMTGEDADFVKPLTNAIDALAKKYPPTA